MKKLLALLLALCILVALVGCSSDDVRGDITDDGSSDVSASESGDVTSETDEPEFSMGKATGKNYENKFLGLGCNLDSNWTFYTDEQIRELNNVTADLVGEEFANQIKDAQIIYDMMASHSNGTDSMNINLENVGLIGGIANLRAYLDNSVPMLKQGLGNMGYSNITTESIQVEIDGKEFEGLDLVADISGMKFYERLFCIKKGNYIASITMASFDKATLEQTTDCFYIVK